MIVCSLLLVFACKKDPPKPPEGASLTFPLNNSECTTGRDLNSSNSEVEFRWQMADHTDTYELRVTNLNSNNTQTISSSSTTAKLPIEKGAPFSWVVISKNKETTESASSNTWQFYNAGSRTSFPPFPATIVAPTSGASVVMDINMEITLQWVGADVDNDIAGYEILLSTETSPTTLIASPSGSTSSVKVDVNSGEIYYWKIRTIDSEGNASETSVYGFRVL